MQQLAQKIAAACDFLTPHWDCAPRVGIILGTGLGSFADEITVHKCFPAADIPHFPKATADGHRGNLICGEIQGVPVITMEGRFHAYEGYSPAEITLPVRVMKALGVELLIISNASGGMNPSYESGDILVIEDHINLSALNPLIGVNDETLGPRFPDMSRAYCPKLVSSALAIARQENFAAHRGVYVGLTGPNYETRAEYRFLRRIGADAVGMSTVHEAIVAAHCGMRVLALSVITNICLPDLLTPTSHELVMQAAHQSEPKMRKIVLGVLAHEAAANASNQKPQAAMPA
ncbi:MAG: purine-nucleoside phosphorylase [Planctomycetota bacterium]|nr:purine-nucleoside phosphorylase [Planctomycetota bacterium]